MSCWNSNSNVTVGRSYRVDLAIREPWLDRTIPTGAEGFQSSRLPWGMGYLVLPLRRSLSGQWFQPFATIVAPEGRRHVQPLAFHSEGDRYVATLVPEIAGMVQVWVNDGVIGLARFTDYFYRNNQGSAEIKIIEIPVEK